MTSTSNRDLHVLFTSARMSQFPHSLTVRIKWNFLLINLTGKIFEKFLVFDLKTSKKFCFKRQYIFFPHLGLPHVQIEKTLVGPTNQKTTLNLKCKYDSTVQVGAPEYVYWSFKKDATSPEQFLIVHSDETFALDKAGRRYQFYNYLKNIVIPDQAHFSTQPIHCRYREFSFGFICFFVICVFFYSEWEFHCRIKIQRLARAKLPQGCHNNVQTLIILF